jgi:hypothetical protein
MMKKPKFGIVIAVTQSPMAKAYKKAVGAKPPKPEDRDPKMLAPKGEKDKGLAKGKMPVAPKGIKPPKKQRRRGMEM